MMKKITKQEIRTKLVGSVVASLRMEQLMPSQDTVRGLNACVAGKQTTALLLESVKQRHVTLRG